MAFRYIGFLLAIASLSSARPQSEPEDCPIAEDYCPMDCPPSFFNDHETGCRMCQCADELISKDDASALSDFGAENVPGAGDEPGAKNEPGAGDEPGAENVPESGDEPGAENVPGAGEEPGAENVLGVGDEPGAKKEPGVGDEPGAKNEPGVGDEPGAKNEPGSGDEPGAKNELGAVDEPGRKNEPGAGDEPGAKNWPGAGDELRDETEKMSDAEKRYWAAIQELPCHKPYCPSHCGDVGYALKKSVDPPSKNCFMCVCAEDTLEEVQTNKFSEDCTDLIENCPEFQHICHKESWMEKLCPVTCESCPTRPKSKGLEAPEESNRELPKGRKELHVNSFSDLLHLGETGVDQGDTMAGNPLKDAPSLLEFKELGKKGLSPGDTIDDVTRKMKEGK